MGVIDLPYRSFLPELWYKILALWRDSINLYLTLIYRDAISISIYSRFVLLLLLPVKPILRLSIMRLSTNFTVRERCFANKLGSFD